MCTAHTVLQYLLISRYHTQKVNYSEERGQPGVPCCNLATGLCVHVDSCCLFLHWFFIAMFSIVLPHKVVFLCSVEGALKKQRVTLPAVVDSVFQNCSTASNTFYIWVSKYGGQKGAEIYGDLLCDLVHELSLC